MPRPAALRATGPSSPTSAPAPANNRLGTEPKQMSVPPRGGVQYVLSRHRFARFQSPNNGTAMARMGISFISSGQARRTTETEIPGPGGELGDTHPHARPRACGETTLVSPICSGANHVLQASFWGGSGCTGLASRSRARRTKARTGMRHSLTLIHSIGEPGAPKFTARARPTEASSTLSPQLLLTVVDRQPSCR